MSLKSDTSNTKSIAGAYVMLWALAVNEWLDWGL